MDINLESIMPVVERWGYLIVLLMTFLENAAFVGLVIPGEVTLLIAGFISSGGVPNVTLSLPWLYVVAITGAITGDIAGYLLGRYGGYRFLLRFGRYFRFKEEHMEKTQGYFQKYGGRTVFVGRFISVVKVFAPLSAGVGKMPFGRFLLYDGLGAVVASILVLTIGYFFGESWVVISNWLGLGGGIAFVLVIAGAVTLLVFRWRKSRYRNVR
ncbi:MAG: DedA family protein [Thermoleophilia bacterium]